MIGKIRKFISTALACSVILCSTLTAPLTASADTTTTASVTESTEKKTYKITKKNFTWYLYDTEKDHKFKVPLYFMNGSDVPYMKIEDCADLYKRCAYEFFNNTDFDITVEKNDDIVFLKRENGYFMCIDSEKDLFSFLDFDAFVNMTNDSPLSFALGIDLGDENSPKYLKKLSTSNLRYGDIISLDLSEYNIDLVRKGKNYYIPLQTFSDVFLASTMVNILYNGKAVFIIGGGISCIYDSDGYTDFGSKYLSGGGTGKISKTMAEFSYNEMCFALDLIYGLKEEHNIKDFRTLMQQIGYENAFLSTNQTRSDKRLFDFIHNELDDQHTTLLHPSYASDLNSIKTHVNKKGGGHSLKTLDEKITEYSAVRNELNPDGVPAYQEIGNTAFITFDTFEIFNSDVDYYKTAPTADAKDTIGIIAYSIRQILRENSPIENVVLDLSVNEGGAIISAIYVLSAFLGTASVCAENPNTGALVTYDYMADTNFDGKFDSQDTLAGKGLNLYCLESGISFSCGNLVPSMFKESGKVTLLGQTSGGGGCMVTYLSTAAGSVIQLSSSVRFSFMKNGSFYSIDRGAAPDVAITKTEHFYDRPVLVEFINGLF